MTNDELIKENESLKNRLFIANYFYKELVKNLRKSLKDKPLCKNCEFCHIEPVGYVSNRSWCMLSGDDGFAIGINPWKDRPHKRCPLMKAMNAGYRKIPNLKGIREKVEKIILETENDERRVEKEDYRDFGRN